MASAYYVGKMTSHGPQRLEGVYVLAAEGAQGALQAARTHLVGALHAHLQAGAGVGSSAGA